MEFKDNGQGFNYHMDNNDLNFGHAFFWVFIISMCCLVIF